MSTSKPTRNFSFSFTHFLGKLLLSQMLIAESSINLVSYSKRHVKFELDIIWHLSQTLLKKCSCRIHISKVLSSTVSKFTLFIIVSIDTTKI